MCMRTVEARWRVAAENGEDDSTIDVAGWFGEAIELIQGPDIIYLQDARQARKVIKAIKKSAKKMEWKV
jgi:hypothetical protein